MQSENEITRAMMAVVVCRFIGDQGLPVVDTAIELMKNAQLMQGDGSRETDPEEIMTKEQIVTVLYRVAEYVGAALDDAAEPAEIQDLGAVSPWAREAVEAFIAKGLITGDENGYFNPDAHMTLGELYQMYLNILNRDDNAFADIEDVVYIAEEAGEFEYAPEQIEQAEPEEKAEPNEQEQHVEQPEPSEQE